MENPALTIKVDRGLSLLAHRDGGAIPLTEYSASANRQAIMISKATANTTWAIGCFGFGSLIVCIDNLSLSKVR